MKKLKYTLRETENGTYSIETREGIRVFNVNQESDMLPSEIIKEIENFNFTFGDGYWITDFDLYGIETISELIDELKCI